MILSIAALVMSIASFCFAVFTVSRRRRKERDRLDIMIRRRMPPVPVVTDIAPPLVPEGFAEALAGDAEAAMRLNYEAVSSGAAPPSILDDVEPSHDEC